MGEHFCSLQVNVGDANTTKQKRSPNTWLGTFGETFENENGSLNLKHSHAVGQVEDHQSQISESMLINGGISLDALVQATDADGALNRYDYRYTQRL